MDKDFGWAVLFGLVAILAAICYGITLNMISLFGLLFTIGCFAGCIVKWSLKK